MLKRSAMVVLLVSTFPLAVHAQLSKPDIKDESQIYSLPAQAFNLKSPDLSFDWNPGMAIEGYTVFITLKKEFRGIKAAFAKFKTLEEASRFLKLLRDGSVQEVMINLKPKSILYKADSILAPIILLHFFFDK